MAIAAPPKSYQRRPGNPAALPDAPPPHNPEAEEATLGAVMLAAAATDLATVAQTVGVLGRDDFYLERHRLVWATIERLSRAGQLPELVTVTDALREQGLLDQAGGASYLTGLLSTTFSPVLLPHYIAALKRTGAKRTLQELGHHLAHHAGNGQNVDALVAFASQVLDGVKGIQFDSPYREGSLGNRILTAAELLEAPTQEQIWLPFWGQQGLIGPDLVTIVSGHSKQAGKSTSLRAGLRDLLRESPDLKALVLSEEPRSIWTRWLATLDTVPAHLRFRFADGSSWTSYLHEVEQCAPDFLAIDTLRSFGGIVDENDSASVIAVVQPLVILARRLNCAVIVCHHLRKSEGDSGLAHAGSTALVALADIAAELRQDKAHHPNRRVVRTVSRFDLTQREFVLELQGQQIVCLGAPDALTLAEVTERVLAVLGGNGESLSRDDVLDALDDPRPSLEQVSRALKTLRGQGRVYRKGKGVRNDPHRWEIDTTTKQPLFNRGIELRNSDSQILVDLQGPEREIPT